MRKTLLSIVIGSALITGSYANAALDHQAVKATSSSQHHNKMMKMDHSKMQGHHGTAGTAHGSEGSLAGMLGKEGDVSRIILVTADDSMRFFHEPINVKKGETIKFVVTNKGSMTHEFAIGTKDEQKKHSQMMMNNPSMHMQHGPGGNAITIMPNESMAIIWKFENSGQIEAACNIPGHYQAGMYSPVNFTG